MTAETIANPSEALPSEGTGIEALLTGAAFAPLDSVGFLRVTGDDRVRWLNGMTTNSIQALAPGEGCYTFFLNAQGRIQGDATAWMLDDAILLETQRDRIPALIAHLDRFIIMDDVELTSLALEGLLITGQNAPGLVQTLCPVPRSTTLHLEQTSYNGSPVHLIQAYSPLVPRFEVWSSAETISQITGELASLPRATPEDLEALRVLEGTPLYGVDIHDRDLPQETAQTRALHFSKGCYLGQEIVERIRSRGNVHRTFIGFILKGPVPAAGTPLFAADAPEKLLGELTSSARIDLPSGPVTLALGTLRREALDRGIQLLYNQGEAIPTAVPYKL